MTVLNVAGLLQETPGAERSHVLRDHYLTLGSDVELAGPLDGELRLQRTNRGILVRGTVRGVVRRTCARCLEGYVEPAEVAIHEEFLPTVDPASGAPLPPPDHEDAAQPIDDHHEIDIGPVLRDEFALAEPMHPLCRPDCPGLCPECGLRLDERHVAHPVDEVDPRLAGLARFLERERD
jgi:uncharacterized protein